MPVPALHRVAPFAAIFSNTFSFYILFISASFVFCSFNVFWLPACVCYACHIQDDGIAFYCLLPFLHYNVVSDRRSL